MKKMVIKILIMVIIVILVVGSQKIIFATETTTTTIPSIMDPTVTDDVNPTQTNEDSIDDKLSRPFTELIYSVVKNILGAIQVIGGLLTIISVAVYGLMMLLYSQPELMNDLGIKTGAFGGYNPEVRKKLMDYIRKLIIGAALLFSSSSIVVFVMGILLS